jgi:hypothetical protein
MGTRLAGEGYYWASQGSLTPDFCKHLIEKFENSEQKAPGTCLGGYLPDIKRSTDLLLTNNPEFVEEDKVLFEALSKGLQEYRNQVPYFPWLDPLSDSGYTLQRTLPGEFFTWHTDASVNLRKGIMRAITFIWYLNDVKGPGGCTEFVNGLQVQPEEGKMFMFPAELSVVHRGVSPEKETKYIVTGWIHCLAPTDG